MARPQFLVSSEAIHSSHLELTGPELRHLRVRRLQPGDGIVLSDGAGCNREGFIEAVDRNRALIRLLHEKESTRESPLHMVLALAAIKPQRFELVVEKATELGVNELIVFTSDRSQPRGPQARLPRWERIAANAAKQSLRNVVPRISGPLPFKTLLTKPDAAFRVLFSYGTAAPPLTTLQRQHPSCSSVLLIVGPEGGFTTDELSAARSGGVAVSALGTRVLRAETAGIVAVVMAQFLWGDLPGSARPDHHLAPARTPP
jgi:16S rRNA (uracil1498-N3)-methyltransferase